MDQEDIQANIDHIIREPRSSRNESLTSKYTKESNKHMLSNNEYNKYMQLLNNKQKEMVMYHRNWCKETVTALKITHQLNHIVYSLVVLGV